MLEKKIKAQIEEDKKCQYRPASICDVIRNGHVAETRDSGIRTKNSYDKAAMINFHRQLDLDKTDLIFGLPRLFRVWIFYYILIANRYQGCMDKNKKPHLRKQR